jgi:hypothetical protein
MAPRVEAVPGLNPRPIYRLSHVRYEANAALVVVLKSVWPHNPSIDTSVTEEYAASILRVEEWEL